MQKNPLFITFIFCFSIIGKTFGITTITQPVETPFGTYVPESQPFTPSVAQSPALTDIQDVLYADRYQFSDSVIALLINNGFAAVPANAQSMTTIYKSTNDAALPVFVTADVVLHAFFKLYENMLKIAEYNRFYAQLDTILHGMLTEIATLRPYNGNDSINLAVTRTAAYLDVAHTLLTDTITFADDPAIRAMVVAETSLVRQHKGFANSNVIPGLKEDFSQYVPRGHYTLDIRFERYFRAMMYLGRINFRDTSVLETVQACILTRLLATAAVGTSKASDLWVAIYNPTTFFVGKSDDLNFLTYAGVLDRVCDSTWRSGDIGMFRTNAGKIIAELQKLPKPEILSGLENVQGFRIMGQRFVPDSYMFGHLVFDSVGTMAKPRLLPRGLDVFATLGSPRALRHLIELYKEDSFVNYQKQMASLKAEFAATPASQWAENLYWNWLYTLVPLLETPGKGYPFFMTTPAWLDKSLVTASGSWAELRHATILYAKQSYTELVGIHCPYSICLPQGYVEPSPEVFGRLAAMVAHMKSGFDSVGLSPIVPVSKLTSLYSLCKNLQTIAIKELQGEAVSISNYFDIANSYKVLAEVENFDQYKIPPSTGRNKPDSSTASIVDVHTDPNSGMVLEVGTGKPMCLYVIAPVEGKLQICRGAMFSYYEFKQPMDNRLTDDQWQSLLTTSSPAMPEWTASFCASRDSKTYKLWEEDVTTFITPVDSIPQSIYAGDSMIAVVGSDTTPSITLVHGNNQNVFLGEKISTGLYRFSIPPEVFGDTTVLIITSRTNGAYNPNCFPPPKVTLSYRKVVFRTINAAIAHSLQSVVRSSVPFFKAGRLIVPPNSSWRIVDSRGRQVASINKNARCWVPPPRCAHMVLFAVPAGERPSKPLRIVVGH